MVLLITGVFSLFTLTALLLVEVDVAAWRYEQFVAGSDYCVSFPGKSDLCAWVRLKEAGVAQLSE